MVKSNRKANVLIKKLKLKNEFRNAGIRRVNKEAIKYFEKLLEEGIRKNINSLSRELVIKGKKTLEKKDIKDFFEKLEKEKESLWEI
jgi:histone H3/H4